MRRRTLPIFWNLILSHWDDFIFMHDNGRPHVAGIVQHYFREVEIGQMQWPARSSDLNLIE
jgi:hypothetical protein